MKPSHGVTLSLSNEDFLKLISSALEEHILGVSEYKHDVSFVVEDASWGDTWDIVGHYEVQDRE